MGKYCSQCGAVVEAPLVERMSSKTKDASKVKANKKRTILSKEKDPIKIRKRKNALIITGIILFEILKIVRAVALIVSYILLGVIFSLALGKGSVKMTNMNWARTPHYGYRYGRWYYGDGHRYGCQNGNGHDGCYRD